MEEADNGEPSATNNLKKVPKRGIIYLSSIPPYMNVLRIREVFGEFGTVGRVYLQLAEQDEKVGEKGEKQKKKRKFAKKFTEGWVEFERKSVAKKVAQFLNNTQVDARKGSKQYDYIWNIKYLSRFKWIHLHERLAYEKAARRQKIRAEIQLAKKKTNFFTMNLDKKKKSKTVVNKEYTNISKKKAKAEKPTSDVQDREDFLKTLFS